MDRRGFLRSLGIGLGAVVVAQSLPLANFFFENTTGPITPEWITAEALRLLKRNLSNQKFSVVGKEMYPSMSWHGIDFAVDLMDDHIGQYDFSQQYIEPVVTMLGNQIEYDNPKSFLRLQLPGGIDFAQIATDEETNLNLRFVRAWNIGSIGEEHEGIDGDNKPYKYIVGASEPEFVSRFELAYS